MLLLVAIITIKEVRLNTAAVMNKLLKPTLENKNPHINLGIK